MNGKIFPESDNVYQDQARILFNYYKQAAEKIVREEERIEGEIKALEEEKSGLEKQISGLWVWFLTILLFFVYFIKKSSLGKQVAQIEERINEFRKQHEGIFRDYKVSKLGVAYVPVAEQIGYEGKSFVVDYTGSVADSEVTLQLSRRNNLLIETIGQLESLSSEAPIVEKSDEAEKIETDEYSRSIQELNHNNYLGGLERSLRTISYCMEDVDRASVSLPLVADNDEFRTYLDEYATREIPAGALVIPVFDKDKYVPSIEKFRELNNLKNSLSRQTEQFEDVLKSLMSTIASSVQAISALKVASVDKVVFESNKMLLDILKAPYNHYSPTLEYEEIERIRNEKFDYSEDVESYEPFSLKQSSRMKYNLLTGMWTAEDGSVSNLPFGVHQIYEEIVAPVVQNLMAENRVERLKIYNQIKDQKMSYLNKWHQDTDAFYRSNRAESADIINLMQESLREYVAAYNTLVSLQRTEDSMVQSNGSLDSTVVDVVDNTAETLAAFELQSQQFQKVQNDFEDYMERLKEDIDLKAERFGHIEYYDAKLRDGYSNEVAVAASEIQQLDERRKGLATVNPLLAKVSELPPRPNVEEITFEHLSLNLPAIAKSALEELEESGRMESEPEERVSEDGELTADEGALPSDPDVEAGAVSGADADAGDGYGDDSDTEAGDDGLEASGEQEDATFGEQEDATSEGYDEEASGEESSERPEEAEESEYDGDEEGNDDEGPEYDGEDDEISEEYLQSLSDDDIMEIMDDAGLEYDRDNFDRDKAIVDILNAYNE